MFDASVDSVHSERGVSRDKLKVGVYRRYTLWRRGIATVGVMFSCYLVGAVVFGSIQRSELQSRGNDELFGGPTVAADSSGPAVYIREFHRVEMKDGKPEWEIKGKDAQFIPKDGVTDISDAVVKIFKQGPLTLNTKSAKLFLKENSLEKVYLEGDVVVEFPNGLKLVSNAGLYERILGKMTAFGDCRVNGRGFEVQGDSMEFVVSEETVAVYGQVTTRFTPGMADFQSLEGLQKLGSSSR